MIITELKPDEEISEMIKPFKKLFIVCCGTCSTSCQTGGEKEVAEMAEKLGEQVIGTAMVEDPCDIRLDRRDLRRYRDKIKDSNAILVMACGAGIQTVGEYAKKPVLPATNTLFIGQTERIGRFHDTCKACSDCILDETGGICSLTRCPKSILNGPCGGQIKGKCEVGDYKDDCAWIKIYENLKDQNRLHLFTEFRPPRDNSKKVLARHHIW
jgi:hypothetical protein